MYFLRPTTDSASKKKAPHLVVLVNGVATAFENNPYFPSPTPTLDVFRAHIKTFSGLVEKGRRRSADENVAYREARRLVLEDLGHLCDYVYLCAQRDPEHAEAIIMSSGLPRAKQTQRNRPPISAKALGNGAVYVAVQKIKGAVLYYWMISLDGGLTFKDLCDTRICKMTTTGLPPRTEVFFRVYARIQNGMSDFVGPTSVVVL